MLFIDDIFAATMKQVQKMENIEEPAQLSNLHARGEENHGSDLIEGSFQSTITQTQYRSVCCTLRKPEFKQSIRAQLTGSPTRA